MDIQNILIIIAIAINSLLGAFVYFKNQKNKVNSWFGFFSITLVFWCIAMILYRLSNNKETSLLWVKILYATALFIPVAFMSFAFIFPDGKNEVKKYIRILIWVPPLIILIFTVLTDKIVSGVAIISGQEKQIFWGSQYLVYNIYFVLYFSILFFVLFRKLTHGEGIVKTQIKFILLGTFPPSILANISNLLLPSFNIFYFNWLGQIMTIPMMGFIAYAILKHHIMNVKVITTEIFSVLTSLALLINALLSESINKFLLNFSLFAIVSFFVILLIRSVLKEVKTREELAELTQELQRANEDLKKLDKAKSEFISIASHQLRTPLSIIKGYVSMLLEGSYGVVPDKAKETLGKIEASNERLTRLINDLLDLSRMEGGRMQFKWDFIGFTDLVQSVVEELKPAADKKKIELRWNLYSEKLYVRADEEKFRQVIMNLVDNAIKYTPEGSVEVKVIKTSEGKARFSVSDTGIGMNQEELNLIFGKFVRGKNTPKLWTEGIGLGLYVARKIMEEHKGTVWAESEGEGKGSTFFVELPVY